MRHRGRHCLRRGGFTLIEVLVALVIVAVGMSVLMGTLTSAAKTVAYMQDKTFAEWVALNQIANVRIVLQQGQIPATGITNGDIDLANRTWHWRQEVIDSQVPGIRRIDVKVRPKDVKGGDDDSWYVTVSGLAGNVLAAPGSANINWGNDGTGLPNGTNNPGTNPGSSLNGGPGTGNSGSGNTGSGNTGSGNTGSGNTTPKGNTRQ